MPVVYAASGVGSWLPTAEGREHVTLWHGRGVPEGLYCGCTIQEAAMRGNSAALPECSDTRSKPCSRQSSVSVTTTAAMHTFPWICRPGKLL